MTGLTARFVAGVKGEAGRRVEYADDAIKGLSLRVTDVGAKAWALRYRTPTGLQRRLTLGGYPALGLREARDEAIKALGAVATGRDVAQEKQAHRRRARLGRTEKPQTLAALWGIYDRDVMPRKRGGTAAYQRWLWTKHVRPRLGDNVLATLDRATIRSALKGIGKEAPITANRALALIRHMLNMAVAEEYLSATPLARMGALYDEVSRDRVLSDDELVRFWRAMEAAPTRADMPVSARMVAALKLVLLTVARPGDVAGIDASEIDTAARSWTIPAGRSKGKRAHTIPLSTDAWALLREAYGAPQDKWRGPAFPNARDDSKPMERMSLTRAMQRIVTDAEIPRAVQRQFSWPVGVNCGVRLRLSFPA